MVRFSQQTCLVTINVRGEVDRIQLQVKIITRLVTR